MVDEDTYRIEILTPVSAVTKALEAVAFELLNGQSGIVSAGLSSTVASRADAKLTGATAAIRRLLRS